MAKNGKPGDNHREGAVRDRDQVYNPRNERWTKRGPDGRFMDQKVDKKPFKGVTKEK
jgi:hypothetical protein